MKSTCNCFSRAWRRGHLKRLPYTKGYYWRSECVDWIKLAQVRVYPRAVVTVVWKARNFLTRWATSTSWSVSSTVLFGIWQVFRPFSWLVIPTSRLRAPRLVSENRSAALHVSTIAQGIQLRRKWSSLHFCDTNFAATPGIALLFLGYNELKESVE